MLNTIKIIAQTAVLFALSIACHADERAHPEWPPWRMVAGSPLICTGQLWTRESSSTGAVLLKLTGTKLLKGGLKTDTLLFQLTPPMGPGRAQAIKRAKRQVGKRVIAFLDWAGPGHRPELVTLPDSLKLATPERATAVRKVIQAHVRMLGVQLPPIRSMPLHNEVSEAVRGLPRFESAQDSADTLIQLGWKAMPALALHLNDRARLSNRGIRFGTTIHRPECVGDAIAMALVEITGEPLGAMLYSTRSNYARDQALRAWTIYLLRSHELRSGKLQPKEPFIEAWRRAGRPKPAKARD